MHSTAELKKCRLPLVSKISLLVKILPLLSNAFIGTVVAIGTICEELNRITTS